jgi:hypothetical protein
MVRRTMLLGSSLNPPHQRSLDKGNKVHQQEDVGNKIDGGNQAVAPSSFEFLQDRKISYYAGYMAQKMSTKSFPIPTVRAIPRLPLKQRLKFTPTVV